MGKPFSTSKTENRMKREGIWFAIPKREITNCKQCSIKIYKKWNKDRLEIKYCAPCYFTK